MRVGELPERSEETQRALGAQARRASGGRSAPHESVELPLTHRQILVIFTGLLLGMLRLTVDGPGVTEAIKRLWRDPAKLAK